ncbi:MAG TPA: hypothetical protein V6C84_07605 [Coleofasciculaceae cyanobacterium]
MICPSQYGTVSPAVKPLSPKFSQKSFSALDDDGKAIIHSLLQETGSSLLQAIVERIQHQTIAA